ncbi:hypothetical protein MA04_04153, partial [Alcanivorax balearicus MACL04]
TVQLKQGCLHFPSKGRPYPRIEESEEEEEFGEAEMGPNGPLDHVYEEIIRVMEIEVEKLQGVLGAAEKAEDADTLLSVVELAQPKAVVRMVDTAGAKLIEGALREGTTALRDAGVQAVKVDLERSKMHLRKAIKHYEEQIARARQILEGRNSGQEKFDEFQAAREREALEQYLEDAANRYWAAIDSHKNEAKDRFEVAQREHSDAYNVREEYRNQYLSGTVMFDPKKEERLSSEVATKERLWNNAAGALKAAEAALSSANEETDKHRLRAKVKFTGVSLEDQIKTVKSLERLALKAKFDHQANESPFSLTGN